MKTIFSFNKRSELSRNTPYSIIMYFNVQCLMFFKILMFNLFQVSLFEEIYPSFYHVGMTAHSLKKKFRVCVYCAHANNYDKYPLSKYMPHLRSRCLPPTCICIVIANYQSSFVLDCESLVGSTSKLIQQSEIIICVLDNIRNQLQKLIKSS